jgi:PAS domain S-box-containing protein
VPGGCEDKWLVMLGTAESTARGERLHAYLEAALDCVIMADASGRVVEFNPAAERTFGYTREEALGRTLAELIVPPSLREAHTRAFARFVDTREQRLFGRHLELTGMRADGSEFPVELALAQVEGEPLLICGAVRDLSDAKRAERDLSRLAEVQAALRRVATLVAEGAMPGDVFFAVAREVANLLDVSTVEVVRFDSDSSATVVADWGDLPYPVGTEWTVEQPSVMATILETGRPGRIDDYSALPGQLAEIARQAGLRSAVGAPIILEGKVWGAILPASRTRVLPDFTEAYLTDFTELLATAISNTQARDDLRRLADEQAALRRVATLVARGTESPAVFDAVCAETGQLIGASSVNLACFTADGFNLTMAGWSLRDTHVPTGTRLPLGRGTINGVIRGTVAPARVDSYDDVEGELAALIRQRGIHSEVGAPVIVEGLLWGALIAGTDGGEPLPAGAERRVASFAELIATAVSNATTRSELIASRARIVTAGDEARRRIERNLHDGTQQRLIAVGLDLQAVRGRIPAELVAVHAELERIGDDLEAVLEDVREISRGLHPALLSQAGLGPSLRALARTLPVPVKLDVSIAERPPESIEIAVYYVVSEALANAVKHAHASEISVALRTSGRAIRATIQDDGVGGADATAGSGLVGLIDRVEALGGRLTLDSPRAAGTTVSIVLPLDDPRLGAGEPTSAGSGGDWESG